FFGSPEFSPDGRTLAAGDVWRVPLLFDWLGGEEARPCAGQGQFISRAFSPPSQRLLGFRVSGATGQHWEVGTGKELAPGRLTVPRGILTSPPVFSADGSLLAICFHDGISPTLSVGIWDTTRGSLRRRMDGFPSGGVRLAFTPDNKTLVETLPSPNWPIRIW